MNPQYTHDILKVVVAQICQNIGWHSIQTTPLELVVDILDKYLKEIAVSTHRYAELYNRTVPNLDDVGLAYKDLNVNLTDLNEYVSYVDPVPCAIKVPKYPVPKDSHLNFLKPGSREVLTRPIHVNEYLPPMQPPDEEEEIQNLPNDPDDKSLIAVEIENDVEIGEAMDASNLNASTEELSPNLFKKPTDFMHMDSVTPKRLRAFEEGRPTREISSVMMTTSGFISPAREGKLPESKAPAIVQERKPTPPPIVPVTSALPVSGIDGKFDKKPKKKPIDKERKKEKPVKELFKAETIPVTLPTTPAPAVPTTAPPSSVEKPIKQLLQPTIPTTPSVLKEPLAHESSSLVTVSPSFMNDPKYLNPNLIKSEPQTNPLPIHQLSGIVPLDKKTPKIRKKKQQDSMNPIVGNIPPVMASPTFPPISPKSKAIKKPLTKKQMEKQLFQQLQQQQLLNFASPGMNMMLSNELALMEMFKQRNKNLPPGAILSPDIFSQLSPKSMHENVVGGKLTAEPDKSKLNIFKKISKVKDESAASTSSSALITAPSVSLPPQSVQQVPAAMKNDVIIIDDDDQPPPATSFSQQLQSLSPPMKKQKLSKSASKHYQQQQMLDMPLNMSFPGKNYPPFGDIRNMSAMNLSMDELTPPKIQSSVPKTPDVRMPFPSPTSQWHPSPQQQQDINNLYFGLHDSAEKKLRKPKKERKRKEEKNKFVAELIQPMTLVAQQQQQQKLLQEKLLSQLKTSAAVAAAVSGDRKSPLPSFLQQPQPGSSKDFSMFPMFPLPSGPGLIPNTALFSQLAQLNRPQFNLPAGFGMPPMNPMDFMRLATPRMKKGASEFESMNTPATLASAPSSSTTPLSIEIDKPSCNVAPLVPPSLRLDDSPNKMAFLESASSTSTKNLRENPRPISLSPSPPPPPSQQPIPVAKTPPRPSSSPKPQIQPPMDMEITPIKQQHPQFPQEIIEHPKLVEHSPVELDTSGAHDDSMETTGTALETTAAPKSPSKIKSEKRKDKEHKKEKKDKEGKIKKKKDKKDKNKVKEREKEKDKERFEKEKSHLQSIDGVPAIPLVKKEKKEKKDKDKIKKEKKEKRREKERAAAAALFAASETSNNLSINSESKDFSDSSAGSVPKLTLKLGGPSASSSPASTVQSDNPKKYPYEDYPQSAGPTYKLENIYSAETKREPSPELARISALVTRPPKQKPSSKNKKDDLNVSSDNLDTSSELNSPSIPSSSSTQPTSSSTSSAAPTTNPTPNINPSNVQSSTPSSSSGMTSPKASTAQQSPIATPGRGRPRIYPVGSDGKIRNPNKEKSSKEKDSSKIPLTTSVKDADGNEVWICPACGRVDDGTPMIGCDGCDAWYHWVCVGIQVPPDANEDWYCRVCIGKKQETQSSEKKKKRKKKDKKDH
uniref:Putative bip2 n=1 Tax=Corethrella appendiculata TaxID=1370023 RepID=W4VRD2_9DIPT